MNSIKQLVKLASEAPVKLVIRPNGHYQILGNLTVNYYPESKNRTAYVAGTTGGKKNVTPEQAIAMSLEAPSNPVKKAKRNNNSARRKRLFRNSKLCHWCRIRLTLEPSKKNTATLEHIIPLSRGGLNNSNNMALACYTCNQERGNDMPELKRKPSIEHILAVNEEWLDD